MEGRTSLIVETLDSACMLREYPKPCGTYESRGKLFRTIAHLPNRHTSAHSLGLAESTTHSRLEPATNNTEPTNMSDGCHERHCGNHPTKLATESC